MKIQQVTDASFRKYGRVIGEYDFTQLVETMENTPVTDEVVYEPSVEQLEKLEIAKCIGIPPEFRGQCGSNRCNSDSGQAAGYCR